CCDRLVSSGSTAQVGASGDWSGRLYVAASVQMADNVSEFSLSVCEDKAGCCRFGHFSLRETGHLQSICQRLNPTGHPPVTSYSREVLETWSDDDRLLWIDVTPAGIFQSAPFAAPLLRASIMLA